MLQGATLAVRPGELLAAIGPNGAGKSTLLKVLSRALVPDAGHAALDGTALADWDRNALARRRAVLPQAPAMAFAFRAQDVVALGRTPHAGRSQREADRRIVRATLAETDTLHLADRTVDTLSGGERQRVHLARVLAQVWPAEDDGGARYLLLDEPTNNLDLAHQHAILARALRFARAGNGVMAVVRDPNLAATYADRIAVIADGAVTASGTPAEVLTPELMAGVFGLSVDVLHQRGSGRPLIVPGVDPAAGRFSTETERTSSCSSP